MQSVRKALVGDQSKNTILKNARGYVAGGVLVQVVLSRLNAIHEVLFES